MSDTDPQQRERDVSIVRRSATNKAGLRECTRTPTLRRSATKLPTRFGSAGALVIPAKHSAVEVTAGVTASLLRFPLPG